jgi:RNA polymerase sigma factor (sigma-70 family)
MGTERTDSVIRHLRRVVLFCDRTDLSDGQLLERFLAGREEAAFEALVRRHGPMVLGVCRRILGNLHDAEDAFQVTFLVLARRSAAVRPRDMVANWLYGVAYRTALKARVACARRRKYEGQMRAMSRPTFAESPDLQDLRPLLDQELERLPGEYRSAVVLCDLEGRTKREAARQLNVLEGTLSSRLARGRALLRTRLVRRGVEPSAGCLTAALAHQTASAAPRASLVASTIKAGLFAAAGQTAASGLISANAATLMEGMVKAMIWDRLKTPMAVLVATSLIGLSAGFGVFCTRAADPAGTTKQAEPKKESTATPMQKGDVDLVKERVPTPQPLILALVGLDKKERIAVRFPMRRADGSDGVATMYYDLAKVKASEAGGKAITSEAIPRLLKEAALAVVALDGREIDPRYLGLLKEGTLVFIMPQPEPEPPQPPPAREPVAPPPAPPAPNEGLNSVEYRVPVKANDDTYFVRFVDSGTVESRIEVKDYRVPAGAGVRIIAPMLGPVPIALDFGFPILKRPVGKDQAFSFWLGFFR